LSEEIGPTFVPGDPIMYLIRFKCKANVRTVSAIFVAQESGAEVTLEGEVEKKERARDTRIQTALLKQPDDSHENPKPELTTFTAWRCTPTRGKRWISTTRPKGASTS